MDYSCSAVETVNTPNLVTHMKAYHVVHEEELLDAVVHTTVQQSVEPIKLDSTSLTLSLHGDTRQITIYLQSERLYMMSL